MDFKQFALTFQTRSPFSFQDIRWA